MEIKVANISGYRDVIISTGDATIQSGLLDADESVDMAKELIFAAEQLLPAYMENDAEEGLAKIRENL